MDVFLKPSPYWDTIHNELFHPLGFGARSIIVVCACVTIFVLLLLSLVCTEFCHDTQGFLTILVVVKDSGTLNCAVFTAGA